MNRHSRSPLLPLTLLLLAVLLLSGCSRETAPQTTPPAAAEAFALPLLPEQNGSSTVTGGDAVLSFPEETAGSRQTYTDLYFPTLPGMETESRTESADSLNTRWMYNAGNCSTLAGNPYVITIFLDDDESSWQEEKVLQYLQEVVAPGLDFIEAEAAKWGVSLEFRQGYYATYGHPDRPVKYDGAILRNDGDGCSPDILDQAALSLGFDSREHMHDCLREYSGQEQIVYNIMLNKGGRSYSLPFRTQDVDNYQAKYGTYNYFMETTVIFTGFTDDSGDTASDTIAHETLHLFGAEDYYMPPARELLARELYPKDIMLCHMPELEYFDLGDFTAYCVGWTHEVPAVCGNNGWWEGRS